MSALNGWTGGQYSLLRALLAASLLAWLAGLVTTGSELFSSAGMLPEASASPFFPLFPNPLFALDAPLAVAVLVAIGLAAGVCLLVGARDRAAAVVLWYVTACLLTRNPAGFHPGVAFVGWLLLAHALLPEAPFGSWQARGRVDPRGGWQLPREIFAAAWIVLASSIAYGATLKLLSPSWQDGTALAHVLESPFARPSLLRDAVGALPAPLLQLGTWSALGLELGFAPAALVRRLRPYLWVAAFGLQLGELALIRGGDLSYGVAMMLLFAFDPAWVRARDGTREPAPVLYYDGHCGLCHRAVRFVLAEDRAGSLRFAPLASASFAGAVPEGRRRDLPDSIVLRMPDGALLARSAALLEIGQRLGGVWRIASLFGRLAPRAPLDRAYDGVARIRHRLFARPADACPVLPPDLRARFES